MTITGCYEHRFTKYEKEQKNNLWKVLCGDFFQQFIGRGETVMDIGAGYCEFINHIKCKNKIAVDLNPDTKTHAKKGVSVVLVSAAKIPPRFDGTIDTIFMSNFLEHLPSQDAVLDVLSRCHKLLKRGGKILILQPNIDLVKERYWNFIDHRVPLNGESLKEALEVSGFQISLFMKRCLPYTTKVRFLPKHPLLVRAYLRIPPWFRPAAGQSFVVGTSMLQRR